MLFAATSCALFWQNHLCKADVQQCIQSCILGNMHLSRRTMARHWHTRKGGHSSFPVHRGTPNVEGAATSCISSLAGPGSPGWPPEGMLGCGMVLALPPLFCGNCRHACKIHTSGKTARCPHGSHQYWEIVYEQSKVHAVQDDKGKLVLTACKQM